MYVGVNFGAAILQQISYLGKGQSYCRRILCSSRLCRSKQGLAGFPAVLVQYEDREDVAEEHSRRDQRDASEDEEPVRSHRGERGSTAGGNCRGRHLS